MSIKDQAWIDAVDALQSQAEDGIEAMEARLTVDQRTRRDRLETNRLFDTAIALLDLTSQQRATLLSAQRTRDLVLRHHKQRKDLAAVKTALTDFETTVSSTLDQSELSERQQNTANVGLNLVAAQQVDEDAE